LREVTFQVNGQQYHLAVNPWDSLNFVIRERLGLTGTKHGCETGGCGSCTVLVDGAAVYSCMMYALQALGKRVTTIEGLEGASGIDSLQKSFMQEGGLQCGFCTPGFLMSARALLDSNPKPSDQEIKEAIVGNLCRCTGYKKIIDSIRVASLSEQR
jgi:aerobic-type carbon monoxide dehydrogenase small subunit (CoxS/CutS family)